MQYRAAICDDMVFYIDEIKEYLERFAMEQEKSVELSVYLDGAELMLDAKKKKFDIIFLDVDMPVMNGIETARKVRGFDEDVVIIFITSHDSFSLEATQVEAMAYMVKPVDYDRFMRITKKAFLLVEGIQGEKQREKRYIEVSIDYVKTPLDVTKIVMMEKCRNQMMIHMENGKMYTCYETLKNMMTRLPRILFFLVSSSLIVNMSYVRDVKAYVITVEMNREEKNLPIARPHYLQIKTDYLNFLKRKRR